MSQKEVNENGLLDYDYAAIIQGTSIKLKIWFE